MRTGNVSFIFVTTLTIKMQALHNYRRLQLEQLIPFENPVKISSQDEYLNSNNCIITIIKTLV